MPDTLIAANAWLLVDRLVTVQQGQRLPRGAVLGRVTASDKYVLSAVESDDGSEVPDLVLAQDVDTTEGDKPALAYARGDFDSRALTLGAGHTIDSITEGLRVKGITLMRSIP